MRVSAVGQSHIGRVKLQNQDAYFIGRNLYAVTDGLSGHPSSGVASSVILEELGAHDTHVDPSLLGAYLARTLHIANRRLRTKIEAAPDLNGIASTIVAFQRSGSTAALAHMGDSRAYLCRAGATRAITEDHNYGNLIHNASLVPRLATSLYSYLDGRLDNRAVHVSRWQLQPGDRFLLCSDGVTSYVSEADIDATLIEHRPPNATVEKLIGLSLMAGGADNATAVVVEVMAD